MPESMADIILVLDQTPIQGYDQRVSASQGLPDKDLSGDSSSTTVAEGGIKPTKLAIALKIRFTDQAQLQSLVNLSRAMGKQVRVKSTKYSTKRPKPITCGR